MTRYTVIPSNLDINLVETALIQNPKDNTSINVNTSFEIITNDGLSLLKLYTKHIDISSERKNGCYIEVIEYNSSLLGSNILDEVIKRFITSVKYSMHFNKENLIQYDFDYLWMEFDNETETFLSDYFEFNVEVKKEGLYVVSLNIPR